MALLHIYKVLQCQLFLSINSIILSHCKLQFVSQTMLINNDGSADLKLVERIINSASLLYIDKYRRQRFRPEQQPIQLRHQKTALDDLRADFTKPIWPLNMTFTPEIVCGKVPDKFSQAPLTVQDSLAKIHSLFHTFAYRLKNQHEDQSSLRINLDVLDHTLANDPVNNDEIKLNMQKLYEHLSGIMKIRAKNNQKIFEKNENNDSEIPSLQKMCEMDLFFRGVLERCLSEDQELKKSLFIFVRQFNTYLCKILDSQTTSTIFTIMPRSAQLGLLIHPLLLPIYNNLMGQFHFQQKRREQRNPNRQPQQPPQQPSTSSQPKFQQIKGVCSKIVFVNLDGYESEHNIDLARALCRHLMYISFPRESSMLSANAMQDEDELKTSLRMSERMLGRYCHGKEDEVGRAKYSLELKDLNRNVFVLPIHSRALYEENQSVKTIRDYESNFVYYMFRELLTNQINDFNPSVIIISYSGKLTIENRHFIEIIKQLVKLGNYKVMFFPNLTRTYLGRESEEVDVIEQIFMNEWELHERGINLQRNGEMNMDLLEKISIFTKISSGTFNLYPFYQEESAIEKFRNCHVLKYASGLLDYLQKQDFQTIKKVHFRSGQLVSVSDVAKKQFDDLKNNPHFNETFNEYEKNLMKAFRNIISTSQDQELKTQEIEQYKDIIQYIRRVHPQKDSSSQQSPLDIFEFEYRLEVMYQRSYKKIYMIIKNKSPLDSNAANNIYRNLVSKQFQIHDGKRSQRIDIFTYSKLLYDHENRNSSQKPLIYLTNHLHRDKYSNFVGRIIKNDNRVQLRPVTLQFLENQNYNPFTILTDWNYHETSKYVFFYWPQKFDMMKWMLSRFAKIPYIPEIQTLVFRATVENPQRLVQMAIVQNGMIPILPRYGCSAYSFESSNQTHMFVFGGFYKNEDNYMKFQNNLDRFSFSDKQVNISNISKSSKKDKKLDAIRPRTYYEILQYQHQADRRKIAIIGGYGKVFSRPYSLMSSVYYVAEFDTKSADIISIKRQTTEPIRVNVPKPIKIRTAVEMQVMADDDSRTTRKRTINSDGFSFHNTQYKIHLNQIKQQQKSYFDFGLIEHEMYREQVQQLKHTPEQNNIQDTKLKFHRGVRNFTNTVTLFIDQTQYIFVIMLETQHEAREKHPGLQEKVHVTSESIMALTNHQTFIYALLRHPVYTLGKCILAEFNMGTINNTTINQRDQELLLQESHLFRQDVARHAIMVVKPKYIAVLHGPKHIQSKHQICEFLLKKTRTVNQTQIKPCQYTLFPLPRKSQPLPIFSSTLFRKIDESVHCYSFGTVQDTTLLYLHLKLNLTKQPSWERVCEFSLPLAFPAIKQHQFPKIQLIDFRSPSGEGRYELIVGLDRKEYSAFVNEKGQKGVEFEERRADQGENMGGGEQERVGVVLDKRMAYRDFEEEEEGQDGG